MTDLDHRFDALDLLEPTDLVGEIDRLAALPEPAPRPERPRRRVAAGLVAAAVFAAVTIFAWSALRQADSDRPLGPTPTPTTSPLDDAWPRAREGATELPAPPTERSGDVRVWTGTQLIVWGGNESRTGNPPHSAQGWTLDPGSQDWIDLGATPLTPRSWAGAVWTGSEVVIWGGAQGSWPGEWPIGDGAAFDPRTRTWRMLPPAPIPANAPLVTAWTGREVIVWGSVQGEGFGYGAAYDPVADTWRTIADPARPMTDSVTGAWTGRELVVVGGNGRKWHANAAAYDPDTDTWRTLANGGLDGNAVAITPTRWGVVGVDYNKHAVLLTEEGWTELPNLPTASCEDYPTSLAISAEVVVAELCGDLVYLHQGDSRWHRALSDLGLVSVYSGSGTVVLVMAYEDYAATEDGRGRFFAFRPPSDQDEPSLADARDLAVAFAALRSHYPFGDGDVPTDAEAQMRTMLAPGGLDVWEKGNISPLWAYYPGFEVLGVEGPLDGTSDVFRARIRLTGYDGLDALETIIMSPGSDLDGASRDLVIVDARPSGRTDHPEPVDRPDGTSVVTLEPGEEAAFPSGVLTEGDTVLCAGRSLAVPGLGTYVEEPRDERGPDDDPGDLNMTVNLDGSVIARCRTP